MSQTPKVILFSLVAFAACAGGPELEPESEAQPLQQAPDAREHGGRFGRGHFGERRLAELTQALELDEAQVAQVRAIFEEERAAPRGERGERHARRARVHERIVAVLTPAQRAKLEALPVERKLAHLTEQLELSEAQAGQIRVILQEAFAQRTQGDDDGDHEARRALFAQTKERIAAVLTPEQRAAFEQMRGRGFGHGGRRGHHGRHRHHDRGTPEDAVSPE